MAISQNHIINIQPGVSAPLVIHCSQGDTGSVINLTVVNGDETFDCSSYACSVHGTRSDRANWGPFTCNVSGSTVSFSLTSDMTAVAGSCLAEVSIGTVGTANFALLVENATFENGVTYSNDVSVYQNILAAVQDGISNETAERVAAVENEKNERVEAVATEKNERVDSDNSLSNRISQNDARINNLVGNTGNSNSEIVDARVGEDGNTYSALGEAIRTQFSNLLDGLRNEKYTLIPITGDWTQGSYLNYANGNIVPHDDTHFVSPYIPISHLHSFIILGDNRDIDQVGSWLYDKYKNKIYGTSRQNAYSKYFGRYIFDYSNRSDDQQQRAEYVRFSIKKVNYDKSQCYIAVDREARGLSYLMDDESLRLENKINKILTTIGNNNPHVLPYSYAATNSIGLYTDYATPEKYKNTDDLGVSRHIDPGVEYHALYNTIMFPVFGLRSITIYPVIDGNAGYAIYSIKNELLYYKTGKYEKGKGEVEARSIDLPVKVDLPDGAAYIIMTVSRNTILHGHYYDDFSIEYENKNSPIDRDDITESTYITSNNEIVSVTDTEYKVTGYIKIIGGSYVSLVSTNVGCKSEHTDYVIYDKYKHPLAGGSVPGIKFPYYVKVPDDAQYIRATLHNPSSDSPNWVNANFNITNYVPNNYFKEPQDSDYSYPFTSLSLFRRIGVVGDSYASGEIYKGTTGKDCYEISWGQILARKHGIIVTNYSSGGLTTRTWLTAEKGLNLLTSSEPDELYILVLGINDTYRSDYKESYLGSIDDIKDDYTQNSDSFYGNYGKIISSILAHAPNAKIVMSTMADDSDDLHKSYNNAIKEIANHFGIAYIVQRDDPFFKSTYYSDNMVWGHPTATVYSGMAEAFDRLITKCLCSNTKYFNDSFTYLI